MGTMPLALKSLARLLTTLLARNSPRTPSSSFLQGLFWAIASLDVGLCRLDTRHLDGLGSPEQWGIIPIQGNIEHVS